MTAEQIIEISKFTGDKIEEFWKPKTEDVKSFRYVDLHYYWILRHKIKAYDTLHLRPKSSPQSLAQDFIYTHERLAGYCYTCYSRLGVMHMSRDQIECLSKKPAMYWKVEEEIQFWQSYETFYFNLGSVLDVMAGAGNIIYGFSSGKENSLKDFIKNLNKAKGDNRLRADEKEMIGDLEKCRILQENLRGLLAHHRRFSAIISDQIWVRNEWSKKPNPNRLVSWRKELRDMVEGRIPSVPALVSITSHLSLVESSINFLIGCLVKRTEEYLQKNNAILIDKWDKNPLDLTKLSSKAQLVFYGCRKCIRNKNMYLGRWFHDVTTSFPIECINDNCNSTEIIPLYSVESNKK